MDSREIEKLLDKYWNCETSLEEEKQLREFFVKGNVLSSMSDASELFQYFEQQRKQPLGDNGFDAAVMKRIKASSPEGKMVNMFTSVAKIAAGVIVVVAASYLAMKEVRKSYPTEMADTYSDPKLALEETKKALMLISKGFGKAQKEASRINLINEAEKVIEGKPKDEVRFKM